MSDRDARVRAQVAEEIATAIDNWNRSRAAGEDVGVALVMASVGHGAARIAREHAAPPAVRHEGDPTGTGGTPTPASGPHARKPASTNASDQCPSRRDDGSYCLGENTEPWGPCAEHADAEHPEPQEER
jgi:hypothetical protein